MKKLKNIVLFAVMFVMLFSFAGSAKAFNVTADTLLTDDNGHTFLYYPSDSATKISQDFAWKGLKVDSTVVYCAEVHKTWPDNVEYQHTIDPMDPGLIYLLQESNRLQQNGQLNNENRFIIQGAIWLYLEGGNAEFDGNPVDEHGVVDRMRTLITNAKAATYSSVGQATIGNVSPYNNGIMSLNSESDYFVSRLIPSLVSGVDTYNVSISGVDGAILVDEDGNTITDGNLSSGKGFYVKVPFANGGNYNKQVTVSITVQTNTQFISPVGVSSEYQRVIGLFETKQPVTKTFTLKTDVERVCVDYVIVGDVKPDPALTDPTPEKKCYEKGINYNQEKELTTRTRCVFKGWNTSRDLTGKWVDGTALNNDMTLYGAWDCPSTVIVPPTAAQAPFIALGIGLIGAAGVLGYYTYNKKH